MGRALAVEVLVGLVAWCAIGPLREGNRPTADLDFAARVPDPPRAAEVVVGVVAAVLAVAVAVGLVRRSGRAAAAGAVAFIVGLVAGGGGRVLTAGSDGANVGGGLVLVFGLPVVVVLTVAALALTRRPAS